MKTAVNQVDNDFLQCYLVIQMLKENDFLQCYLVIQMLKEYDEKG